MAVRSKLEAIGPIRDRPCGALEVGHEGPSLAVDLANPSEIKRAFCDESVSFDDLDMELLLC
jgi:hypothetical protein